VEVSRLDLRLDDLDRLLDDLDRLLDYLDWLLNDGRLALSYGGNELLRSILDEIWLNIGRYKWSTWEAWYSSDNLSWRLEGLEHWLLRLLDFWLLWLLLVGF